MRYLHIFWLLVVLSCSENELAPASDLEKPYSGFILDEFNGEKYFTYTNQRNSFFSSFSTKTLEGETIAFDHDVGSYSTALYDESGSKWNGFGRCSDGPNRGKQLQPMNFLTGFWFGIAAFYPKATIFGYSDQERIPFNNSSSEWTIDPSQVFVGALKDGIPSIDNAAFEVGIGPKNENVDTYIRPEDPVILVFTENSSRIFPLSILNWHEVINFSEGENEYVLSYCPLTGTGGFWDVTASGITGRFGVSGLLYNNNLILYDQSSDSYWSQLKQEAVHGDLIGSRPELLPYYEMTFQAALALNLDSEILAKETGFERPYDVYPYGDHRTNHSAISYPLDYIDSRLPAKERVLAVIVNDAVKVYKYSNFSEN